LVEANALGEFSRMVVARLVFRSGVHCRPLSVKRPLSVASASSASSAAAPAVSGPKLLEAPNPCALNWRGPNLGVAQSAIAETKNTRRHREDWWLPFLDTYRTMCLVPKPDFRRVLEDIRAMQLAA
jgi:hypothetical protein